MVRDALLRRAPHHEAEQGVGMNPHGFFRFLPLLILLLCLAALLLWGGWDLDFARFAALHSELRALIEAHPVWAALAYVAAYAGIIAVSLPIGSYMTVLGGLTFGPVTGTLLAATGATAGAGLLALALKTALGDALRKRAGPRFGRFEAGFRDHAFSYLLALRLIPVFPFWFVNLLPGFVEIKLPVYLTGTFLGILPATFLYAGLGHGLGTVLAEGRAPDLSILARPELLLPLFGLAFLALLPVLWKKRGRFLRRSS